MKSYLDSRYQITRSREEPDRSHYIVTDTETGQSLWDAGSYDAAVAFVRGMIGDHPPRAAQPEKCAPLN